MIFFEKNTKLHIDRNLFSCYNHRVRKKVKVVMHSGKKVKPFVYEVDKHHSHAIKGSSPQIIEFKDEEIDMYCDDENLPPIYKDIEELYLFLKDVEVERREQVLREVCPDESEENIAIVMECITDYEREHGLKMFSNKELRAIAKKAKKEEKAFLNEILF